MGEELPDEKLVLVLIGSFRFHGRLVAWGKQSGEEKVVIWGVGRRGVTKYGTRSGLEWLMYRIINPRRVEDWKIGRYRWEKIGRYRWEKILRTISETQNRTYHGSTHHPAGGNCRLARGSKRNPSAQALYHQVVRYPY